MNAAPRLVLSNTEIQSNPSQVMDRSKVLEKSFRKFSEDAERHWFARQLWRAFPEATSEHELSELVAEVLTSDRRAVTPRTVRNWLRCENSPHFRYVMQILALVGAEALFEIIDGEVAA